MPVTDSTHARLIAIGLVLLQGCDFARLLRNKERDADNPPARRRNGDSGWSQIQRGACHRADNAPALLRTPAWTNDAANTAHHLYMNSEAFRPRDRLVWARANGGPVCRDKTTRLEHDQSAQHVCSKLTAANRKGWRLPSTTS